MAKSNRTVEIRREIENALQTAGAFLGMRYWINRRKMYANYVPYFEQSQPLYPFRKVTPSNYNIKFILEIDFQHLRVAACGSYNIGSDNLLAQIVKLSSRGFLLKTRVYVFRWNFQKVYFRTVIQVR